MFSPLASLRRHANRFSATQRVFAGLLASLTLGAGVPSAQAQSVSTSGLRATFFSGTNLQGEPLAQLMVPRVDFDWGAGSPNPAVPVDGWSVRYEGTLTAPYTGDVLIETLSDDGVRLWVGGQKVIDNWTDNGTTSDDAFVSMVKGQKIPIVGEFYEASGLAVAKMRWRYPGRPAIVIPDSAFVANGNLTVNPTPTPTPTPTPEPNVLYVAPSGKTDGNGALNNPVRTLSRAVQIAKENDQIVLRGGNYDLTETVWVNKAGLQIRNFNGEKPVLRASNAENSTVPHILVINRPRVTVSGLETRGGSYYGIKIDIDEDGNPASDVTIRNCRIGSTGRDCIKTFNADNLLIEGCNIGPSGLRDASNAEGIDSIGSHGVTIRGCFVHNTATTGIYLKGGATDGLIENCKVQNTRAHGILLGQDTDLEFMRDGTPFEALRCTARNNIISNTLAAGIGTYSGQSISFENNSLSNVARESNAGLMVSVNRRRVGSTDVSFSNNVIEMSGSRPFIFLLEMAGSFSAQNNRYRWKGSPNIFRVQTTEQLHDYSLEEWQAASKTDYGSTAVRVLTIIRTSAELQNWPTLRALDI